MNKAKFWIEEVEDKYGYVYDETLVAIPGEKIECINRLFSSWDPYDHDNEYFINEVLVKEGWLTQDQADFLLETGYIEVAC